MGVLTRCSTALLNVAEEIFPFFHYVSRKASTYRQARSERILDEQEYVQYPTLSTNKLLERLREERQRASAIDEKTFKMTLSLSVGLTILGSTSAVFVNHVSLYEARIVLVALIILGIFYALASGYIALGALRTLPSYGYGTQHLLLDPEQQHRILAECLARSESINLVRQLRNEAAYQSLRNGLILLFFAAAVFATFIGLQT